MKSLLKEKKGNQISPWENVFCVAQVSKKRLAGNKNCSYFNVFTIVAFRKAFQESTVSTVWPSVFWWVLFIDKSHE